MSDIDHRREVGDQFLSHYGKKGMRWGHRRGSSKTAPPVKLPGTRGYNTKKLSNAELKKVIDRMDLEQKYDSLNKKKLAEGEKWRHKQNDKFKDMVFKAVVGGVLTYAVKQALEKKDAKKLAEGLKSLGLKPELPTKDAAKVTLQDIQLYKDFYKKK